ncbi:hypothetical protein A2419_03085 [Candidatus Adlerbacteria bacterium RIFOXYC1_FULL_48_26]|uniref:Uncharacterized protein n=1 Tax=Candidatus Adlerbacteria bacterium RIFOXYC1_FULL_48_26 TaxID=1797247 RepID=A0A1F4Y488_9BACT|nr:MAG: hypothetical protein A2419_03085 [Candidatus Adlerbacteria bacterium RIFOXYC1_FULL_48_26]OGC93325.1 MAG: hypothetical protein A2389_01745 [Candidatus Adlerbacteria bacterium RIFOXYB1_FULL_48_10]OGC96466.1 MAG: hypothetical protein A2590_02960 [Candidatus Adlerbacteria bacterium RIFOXYD1_FULL_48_8]
MAQDPQDQNSKNSLDLNNILLPKKDAPSVDSAQRVDAGTLMQQEQAATLQPPVSSSDSVSRPPVTHSPQEGIAPLQTFQGDIASAIGNKGVSVVSIAAAEANRRGTLPVSQDAQITNTPAPHTLRNIVFAVIGLLFVAGAVGALTYIVMLNAPLPQQQAGVAPFIAIDSTNTVSVEQTVKAPGLMQRLVSAKNSVSISLGLVAQLYVEQSGTSTEAQPTYMSAQTLLSTLASGAPETLVRDVSPIYLLGVHSFGVNQPFLILKVDSYAQGYAGMLTWEKTMKKDLAPLFTYVPAPKIGMPKQNPAAEPKIDAEGSAQALTSASSTATSTPIVATSTPEVPPLQTGFTDAIVQNHDARVTTDKYGTIDFLWTFLDRQTLVITTNPDTLREIITRLKQAPILYKSTSQ